MIKRFWLAALATAAVIGLTAHNAAAATYVLERRLSDYRIDESSGLARSTWDPTLLWTHNDKGGSAHIFAVGNDGRTRATYELEGADAIDWEDIAAGPNHTLWVGDIGDNYQLRNSIQVYQVAEPAKLSAHDHLDVIKYSFTYPDGAHDAEALMVDPKSGQVYIVTKISGGAYIYAAPAKLSTTGTNKLTRLAPAPPWITGGAIRPQGGFVMVNYRTVYTYSGFKSSPKAFAKPYLQQGESVEVSADGKTLYLGSEGTYSPIYRTAWYN